jgi:uncharacterized protein YfkK (UPF0435 family)
MDLSEKSASNLAFMVEQIKDRLNVATAQSIKAEQFDLAKYDDLKDMYEYVMGKTNFSISEIDALCGELRQLKKP